MNWEYHSVARSANFAVDRLRGDDLLSFPIEKARLRATYIYTTIMAVTTIGYGWTLEVRSVSPPIPDLIFANPVASILRFPLYFSSSLALLSPRFSTYVHEFGFLSKILFRAAELGLPEYLGLCLSNIGVRDASCRRQSRSPRDS